MLFGNGIFMDCDSVDIIKLYMLSNFFYVNGVWFKCGYLLVKFCY